MKKGTGQAQKTHINKFSTSTPSLLAKFVFCARWDELCFIALASIAARRTADEG